MNLDLVIEKFRNDLSRHAEGELVSYGNDELLRVVDAKLNLGELAALRRAVLFSGLPVVPEQSENRRTALSYRLLSQADYDQFTFTERNFKALPQEVVDIVERTTTPFDGHPLTTINRLALLICAEVVYRQQSDGRGRVRLDDLGVTVQRQTRDVEMLLQALANLKVITMYRRKGNVFCGRVFARRTNSPSRSTKPAKSAKPAKRTGQTPLVQTGGPTKIFKRVEPAPAPDLAQCPLLEGDVAGVERVARNLTDHARRQAAKIAELTEQVATLTAERDELSGRVARMQAASKAKQERMATRMESIVARFNELVFDAVRSFDEHRNRARFIKDVNTLTADTAQSLTALAASRPKASTLRESVG